MSLRYWLQVFPFSFFFHDRQDKFWSHQHHFHVQSTERSERNEQVSALQMCVQVYELQNLQREGDSANVLSVILTAPVCNLWFKLNCNFLDVSGAIKRPKNESHQSQTLRADLKIQCVKISTIQWWGGRMHPTEGRGPSPLVTGRASVSRCVRSSTSHSHSYFSICCFFQLPTCLETQNMFSSLFKQSYVDYISVFALNNPESYTLHWGALIWEEFNSLKHVEMANWHSSRKVKVNLSRRRHKTLKTSHVSWRDR